MKTSFRPLLLLLALWGFVAVLAGSVRLIAHLPPPVLPLLVASLSVSLTVASTRVAWLRLAVEAIPWRGLLALHVLRFVGFYFLWLHAQGRMPAEFALRAGWGDVAAAAGATILLIWPAQGPGFRRAVLAWNGVGVLDLLVAVGTGAWVNVARPGSMLEITGLPLALVPLWIVPVLVASHVIMFRRLARGGAAAGDPRLVSHA